MIINHVAGLLQNINIIMTCQTDSGILASSPASNFHVKDIFTVLCPPPHAGKPLPDLPSWNQALDQLFSSCYDIRYGQSTSTKISCCLQATFVIFRLCTMSVFVTCLIHCPHTIFCVQHLWSKV